MNRSFAVAVAVVVLGLTPAAVSKRAAAGEAAVFDAAAADAVKPVAGRVVRRFDPPRTRYGAGHRGVDLQAAPGQPVVAALGGTVTFAGGVAGVGWVTVGHGGGLETTYGPIDPRVVDAGEAVAAGSVLGFVAAGASHLDWGAKVDDAYIDPLGLLGRWETYLTTPDDRPALPPLGGVGAVSVATAASPGGLAWPAQGGVSSGFGPRVHPVTGEHRLHAGLDIAAGSGTPIRAAAPGVVSFAGTLGGYGTTTTIDHGGGVVTLYAHQSAVTVSDGMTVRSGQMIGRVGSTGQSTGPHLHFEVRVDSIPSDPLEWLRR